MGSVLALATIVHLQPCSIEANAIAVPYINELLLAGEWVGVLPIKDRWAPVHVASMVHYGAPQPVHMKWVLLVFPVNVQLWQKCNPITTTIKRPGSLALKSAMLQCCCFSLIPCT